MREGHGVSLKVIDDPCCVPRRLKARDVVAFTATLKALADETRLQIMALLAASEGPVCACEFEARFGLSQPTISHHMKVLKAAGLVTGQKQGTWVYYEVVGDGVDALRSLHALLRAPAEER
jgi:ArsR family transcriptional regulator